MSNITTGTIEPIIEPLNEYDIRTFIFDLNANYVEAERGSDELIVRVRGKKENTSEKVTYEFLNDPHFKEKIQEIIDKAICKWHDKPDITKSPPKEKALDSYGFMNNPYFKEAIQKIIDKAVIKWRGNNEPDTTEVSKESHDCPCKKKTIKVAFDELCHIREEENNSDIIIALLECINELGLI